MLKRIKYYLLAFVVGVALFSLICCFSGFVPFGKYIFNIFDSFKMYPALLAQLKRTMFSANVFYTLNAGLGVDFFNIKTLYMNSPLNILFLLFDEKYIYYFYTFLIYFRVGLATITMCFYLNSISKMKYSKNNILFSLMYSLSTYYVALSYHIMWMDLFILLPLIIRGLDKLIEENKSLMYILFLSLSIIINFYIGYMICIFCLIYFIYRYLMLGKKNWQVIKRFLFSSLLCGCIGSVVLFPEILSLLSGRGNEFSWSSLSGISIYSLSSLFYNLLPGSFKQIDNINDGPALIYCSIFAIVICILYFFNRAIKKKEKIITLVFLLFFLLSFFVNFIDYSWNMFQAPIWWSHRYAFVFVFFLVRLSLISYEGINDVVISRKQKLLIVGLFILLFVLSFSCKTMQIAYYGVLDIDVLILFLSLVIFVLYFFFFKQKSKILVFILLIIEIVGNGVLVMNTNKLTTVKEVNEYLDKGEVLEAIDNDFARVYYVDADLDLGMFLNYKTITLFSSSYNTNIRKFLFDKVGVYTDHINRIDFEILNPAIMSLLNFKYIIGNSDYYFMKDDNVNVNENVLDMMFVVDEDFTDSELIDGDYYNNINKIYTDLIGEKVNLFYEIDNLSDFEIENFILKNNKFEMNERQKMYSINYSFKSDIDGVLIASTQFYENFAVTVNDKTYVMRGENFDGIVPVKKGDIVKFSLDIYGEEYISKPSITVDDLKFVVLDDKKLNEIINLMKNSDKFYDFNTDNKVIGAKINSSKKQKVFLTIPYQKGFTIYVDGKKVNYYSIYGTFTGFDIDAGEHEVKVTYFPPGLKLGFSLTLVSIAIALVYVRKELINKK